MRLLKDVYEGPGSHGILRLAAGIGNLHAVLRAAPGEGYMPALYGSRERDGVAGSPTRRGTCRRTWRASSGATPGWRP